MIDYQPQSTKPTSIKIDQLTSPLPIADHGTHSFERNPPYPASYISLDPIQCDSARLYNGPSCWWLKGSHKDTWLSTFFRCTHSSSSLA